MPNLRKQAKVARQSLLKGKFPMVVLPEAIALKIILRWAMDLSPGRENLPSRQGIGLTKKDFIYLVLQITLSPSFTLSLVSIATNPAADMESWIFSILTSPT